MRVCQTLLLCLCGRRPSNLRKLLVLIIALGVVFWVSLLGHQQRQSLQSSEQGESPLLNGVMNFDISSKGKNTPRVLMDANNGRVLNHLVSDNLMKKNQSALKVRPSVDKKVVLAGTRNHSVQVQKHLGSDRNLTNASAQQVVAISKHQTPLASDSVHLDPVPSQKGPDSLQLLHQRLQTLNRQQRVLNADKFPPLSNDGLVLIVQVHKRENYLKQLFESLKRTKGIEKVLLVISHDYYYDDMNAVVASVDFCRVSLYQLVIQDVDVMSTPHKHVQLPCSVREQILCPFLTAS